MTQPSTATGAATGHFDRKVAIVTGGSSGIGRALSDELARRGAHVVMSGLNGDAGKNAADEIVAAGGSATFVRADVTDAGQVGELVRRATADHGRLDFMFNNAGMSVCGEARDLELDHWRQVIDVNLMGVIHGTHAAYAVMVRQGFGHIVNTASLAGLMPMPLNAPYSAAKYGVVGLSTSIRQEARALGVRVSVVCPSAVQTPMFRNTHCVGISPEFLDRFPIPKQQPAAAARAILRGVEKNREIILFPLHAHVFWRLYRLCPPLVNLIMGTMLTQGRALRTARATAPSPSDKS